MFWLPDAAWKALLKQRKVKAAVPSTASQRTPYPLDSEAYKRRNLIEGMLCGSK